MTSRYCYCPMTSKRLARRMSLADRFRRWRAFRRACKPDMYTVNGYNAPVYPGK